MRDLSATLAERAKAISRLPDPDRAREIREAAGVTMVEVAEAIGVDRVTVHRWETGVRRPRGENAARYSKLLTDLDEAVS